LASGGGPALTPAVCKFKYDSLYRQFKSKLVDSRNPQKKDFAKPWPFFDVMFQINKDKPEIKLDHVSELGGVPKRLDPEPQEEDEEVRRPRKRLRLGDCLGSLMEQDREREREQKAMDIEFLTVIKGIKESNDRKNAQVEKNGETFSRLTDALINSLSK